MPTVLNDRPLIDGRTATVLSGVSLDMGSLVQATDPNGDAITQYELWDASSAASSGYFTVNGVKQAALTSITVSAAQWSTVRWVGGSAPGAELGWVRATDGMDWSYWDSFTATTSGFTNSKPVSSGRNTSVIAGVSVSASSLFSVTDTDQDTITAYRFWDSNASTRSGYFAQGGEEKKANQVITVGAGELSGLTWNAGSTSGTDLVWVQAFDGKEWGDWASWTMTTSGRVNTPPVTIGNEVTVQAGLSVNASSLFTVTDAENDTITSYMLWDSSQDGGYFTVNGVRQAAQQVITVTASQFANTTQWVAGSSASTDIAWARAFDRTDWSDWDAATITVAGVRNTKPTVTARNTTVLSGLSVNAASLFSIRDADGDTMTAYQLWDSGSDSRSGYFQVGGQRRSANTAIALSASELAGASWVGGSAAGTEDAWVRAFDGKEWSDWTSIAMTTTRTIGIAAASDANGLSSLVAERQEQSFSLVAA